MKILIVCSKHFYDRIPPVQSTLQKLGHAVMMPNSYDEPFAEERMKTISPSAHQEWKAKMMRRHHDSINANDAVLVLNFEKKGQPNYIGGATFMEIAKAFELEKKIFLYNPIPETIFKDELLGMGVSVIDGELTRLS